MPYLIGNERARLQNGYNAPERPLTGVLIYQSKIEKLLKELLGKAWVEDEGEDIAEYAVMLAVILVIVVGTIRLIGTQANNVFSETASALQ